MTLRGLTSDEGGGRTENGKGSEQLSVLLWAPPPAGRQGAHPNAFMDANSSEVQEAATNEPKQKRTREEEKARRREKGREKQEGN